MTGLLSKEPVRDFLALHRGELFTRQDITRRIYGTSAPWARDETLAQLDAIEATGELIQGSASAGGGTRIATFGIGEAKHA